MKKRTIVIKVDFDMRNLQEAQINPKNKVKSIVEQDMVDHFCWDECYEGVTVQVVDE